LEGERGMDLDNWFVIACVIVVIAGVALVVGKLDAKDFIAVINLVIGFLTGRKVGIEMGKRVRGKRSK